MREFLVAHEAVIRLLAFVGIFAVMALWEFLGPRRARAVSRRERWPSNLALVGLNTLVVRLILPTSAVSLALLIEARHGGLLSLLELPPWLAFGLALALLDLTIYLQHVLFHAVPVLWRLHRMHHADVDVDVTNGLRFHSLEIVLSMGIKFALIAALGPPAAAVVVFEVLLNGLAVFNHANVRMNERVDGCLRWLIVTPDMHRIHHSWHTAEHNRNFGFNLTWWDRLFGTYLAQPRDGQHAMTLGLPVFRAPEWRRLDRMLVQPFVEAAVDHDK
jgi:sterol desaturase/sphingolipid hydroxylase (fatty acid hydroxylase superfamily)